MSHVEASAHRGIAGNVQLRRNAVYGFRIVSFRALSYFTIERTITFSKEIAAGRKICFRHVGAKCALYAYTL